MGPLANHAIVWRQLYFLLFFLKTEVFQNLSFYSKIKVLNTVNNEPAQERAIRCNELQNEDFVNWLRCTMHEHGMSKFDMKCRQTSSPLIKRLSDFYISYVILKKCFGFTYTGYQLLRICRSHHYTN